MSDYVKPGSAMIQAEGQDPGLETFMTLIARHPANPILSSRDLPYPSSLVFNAGVARWRGRYAMLFRNDAGFSPEAPPASPHTNVGLAFSDDGISWLVEPDPVLDVERAAAGLQPFFANRDVRQEVSRFYDPRLTVIDDRAYLCFAVDTRHGIRGGLACSDDLRSWQFLHLSAPDNRNMVLFPERIDGRYWRLERPFPVYGRHEPEAFDIWISSSRDLHDWSSPDLVAGVEDFPFANRKIGPGAPPIRCRQGWLSLTHAVDYDESRGRNGWESGPWKKRYTIGCMLHELGNPTRVLGIAREPVMVPEAPYEIAGGFRNDVLFPGGLIDMGDGTVRIYYGAADTVECVATARIQDLVDRCLAG
jgi:beta-1,4-mannooligosaccharide/beta-1,4-mannosyl-N-acetylglucosamine phosphorylase